MVALSLSPHIYTKNGGYYTTKDCCTVDIGNFSIIEDENSGSDLSVELILTNKVALV